MSPFRSRIDGPDRGGALHLAWPQGRCPPVVVVLDGGASALSLALCDDLAAEGFLALVPVASGLPRAEEGRPVANIVHLLQLARALPGTSGRVGLLGAGTDALSVLSATARHGCDAAVVYGAQAPLDRLVAECVALRSPVLLHLPAARGDALQPLPGSWAELEWHPRVELHDYAPEAPGASQVLARARSLRFLRRWLSA